MITLEETIVRAKEMAREKYNEGFLCHANPNDDELDNCIECAKEYEQLAEWFEELKQYRDTESASQQVGKDTINMFANKLKDSLINKYTHLTRLDSDGFRWITIDAVETHINELLKEITD